MTKPRRDEEHQNQVALFQWARLEAMRLPELVLLHANTNGGRRDAVTGARLKAEGALAGIPDIHLPVPRGKWASLWIELKTEKGRVQSHQREMLERLQRAGNKAVVCRGWLEARRTILEYLDLEAKQ